MAGLIVFGFSFITTSVFASTPSPSVTYQAQVQNIGWQKAVSDGATAGTIGKGLRLEAIKISLNNLPQGLSGGIQYRLFVNCSG